MNQQDRMRATREAGKVLRCHNVPHHGTYSVAEHSWQAVMLMVQLHPDPSRNLLIAMACHDVAERFYGDQPVPVGWAKPEIRRLQKEAEAEALTILDLSPKLNHEEEHWLNVIDKLELLLWTLDQDAMGNLHCCNVEKGMRDWFRSHLDTLPKTVQDFMSQHEWKRGDERLP